MQAQMLGHGSQAPTLIVADVAALSAEHAGVASLVAAVVDQPTLLGVVERVAAARAEPRHRGVPVQGGL